VLGFGARGFVLVNVVQIATGLWWIVMLPRGAMLQFMGRDPVATASLVLSLLLTASAMWILWGARDAAAPGRKVIVGAAHVGVIFLLMVLMRDAVRRGTLGERFQTSGMASEPQWGPIVVFVVLLVAGIATIGWMVAAMQKKRAEPSVG
jgi:NADH:ubiquinone oxidoreductase subunit 6 (subunit J)